MIFVFFWKAGGRIAQMVNFYRAAVIEWRTFAIFKITIFSCGSIVGLKNGKLKSLDHHAIQPNCKLEYVHRQKRNKNQRSNDWFRHEMNLTSSFGH